MYIEPNTRIRFLENCPLDKTYEHTLYFSSKNSQTDYFMSLTKYAHSEQTYQRVKRGTIRIHRKADDLYNCNYVMFQNTAYGNKWFYGFVTSVEFINNETSEVSFEIDVMQTWFFDYELKECYVVREHIVTDTVGANLVPENLALGDYIYSSKYQPSINKNLVICIACNFEIGSTNEIFTDFGGQFFQGAFTGLKYYYWENNTRGAELADDFLKSVASAGKGDGIASIFLAPHEWFTRSAGSVPPHEHLSLVKRQSTLGDYKPKNKKLLTYPFNMLYVTNNNGSTAEYHYEYFNDDVTCYFEIQTALSPNPSCLLVPLNYKTTNETNEYPAGANWDEKIGLSGFPQLPYNIDTYRAFTALQGSGMTYDIGSSLFMGATSGAVGGAFAGGIGSAIGAGMGMVTGPLSKILSWAKEDYLHAKMPDQLKGAGGDLALAYSDNLNFTFYWKHIRPEFARMIDDFFEMFGYATKRLKVPNTHSRPHWNYVKTAGCVVVGSIPADDMEKICNIYDEGITFWKKGSEVGDYSLNNH